MLYVRGHVSNTKSTSINYRSVAIAATGNMWALLRKRQSRDNPNNCVCECCSQRWCGHTCSVYPLRFLHSRPLTRWMQTLTDTQRMPTKQRCSYNFHPYCIELLYSCLSKPSANLFAHQTLLSGILNTNLFSQSTIPPPTWTARENELLNSKYSTANYSSTVACFRGQLT